MKMLFWVIVGLVFVIGGSAIWMALDRPPVPPPARKEKRADIPSGGLDSSTVHIDRAFVRAESTSASPSPVPEIVEVTNKGVRQIETLNLKRAPMLAYSATNIVAELKPPEDKGFFCPRNRMIRCKLVNTVDSSNAADSPIDGLVTDDLIWRGHMIIARCSEVHMWAQFDKAGERILGQGVVTFVLAEKDGLGNRELIVKGHVMDREDDPEFFKMVAMGQTIDSMRKTWGITDASAGLRGVVLKTDNLNIINAFVAAFIGGMAGTVTQFSSVIAPEQGGQSVSLPSYVAAPAAQGIANVMNNYASTVLASIEKDGFFLRVPAGKLYYIRTDEEIWTGNATMNGSDQIRAKQREYLDDRELGEKVQQPRSERQDKKEPQFPPIDPSITRKMDDSAAALQARAQQLQNEASQLAQPASTPSISQ